MQIPSFLGSMKSLTYLNLSYARFSGSIPHQIAKLSSLIYLDLESNSLNGSIPHQIADISNLIHLDFGGNSFTGPIPHQIGNLSGLLYLDLDWGIHYEDMERISLFPENLQWLSSLSSLKYLQLSYVNLSNAFDWLHVLQSFPSLTELHLMWCTLHHHFDSTIVTNFTSLAILGLQGFIPNGIQNLTLIEDLDLSSNLFNSSIPDWFYSLSHLKSLSIRDNNLHGTISYGFGNLNSMVTLDSSYNHLGGPIPSSLRNLCEIPESLRNFTSLNHLYLDGNQFNGNPFDAIQSLVSLQSLGIGNNLFQGEVHEEHLASFAKLHEFFASRNKLILKVGPNWIPSFQKLKVLYMDSWHLGPYFPSWVQSLKCLEDLSISNSNISDYIPPWVWDAFPHASYFDFSNNDIHGEISDTLKNPINISSIDLRSNHLSGHLPHISPYVYYLDLSSNWFSGSIDSLLCQKMEEPMKLVHLNLASNKLSGAIPDCWMMWKNLVIVKFDDNFFSGNLPTSLGSLPWLGSLQLQNNLLSRNFLVCLKNNTKLVLLDLRKNQSSGIIPLWVGQILLNLEGFLLESNNFFGEIPNQICSSKFLQILNLAHNNLTGQLPKCINHLNAMLVKNKSSYIYLRSFRNDTFYSISDVLLDLKGRDYEYRFVGLVTSIDPSSNKPSGEIPREITSLMGLIFLNLSNNILHGHIPQSIGNMKWLETMDLSKNQLGYEIPPSMSKLNFLNKLNLSYNNLTGKIPTGTQLQSFEVSSFVGNYLCGPPLQNYCTDNVPEQDNNEKEAHEHRINWFYVSMSLGFVSGFWVVIGPLLYSTSWRWICVYTKLRL
ncbi:receptor-like protein EIX2 [Prosopis cineraria]|uniref:receptor-like protein EIX2 n=1 Tax=Prosopis cineraria TaxID=364024 RepID=UPI002410145D|nr:receptor-like protein EIX2 [Prosopis cineraria]